MTTLDLLGHLGYLFITVGMLLIAAKSRLGWLARLIGEGIWVWIGIALGFSSIWLWGLLFMCIDVAAFYLWRRENETSVS